MKTLSDELLAALGEPVLSAESLVGGEVNAAVRLETPTRTLVAKWNKNCLPGLFDAEVDGLARLRAADALRVPTVIAHSDAAPTPFLLLEYLPPARPVDLDVFTARFADGLVAQHRVTAPDFGLERDNYLGSQPQTNAWDACWSAFYRERRLLPQIERARRLSRLTASHERLLGEILARLDELLLGMDEPPALLHGDLWSGNFLCLEGDVPALIDPAVYFGPREMELAYIELFGGFPARFIAAYGERYPLDPGYARRRPLHQLYPLVIHLNHFGQTYGPALEAACRQALAT